ncbi:riboflavin synthase subunit alpha [Candidatus Nomurabacteria bacterium RIFCSPHIGHO2_01_FULL_38_19]|uniref:Riboflavin synthase n=1 Tax=Candidatus Nomurabacteria bacterium RIFCSPHIGHO2_01_FULL_38_19 TaxID=1801732 RepID=A0A1F6UTX1_9BACT|nr:MAG: riboflavin synthase subunit alpha [Candidatus Nomurabacteria bacterium RIFCSPHIGHO2_01_FULL_38_19]
MFTGIISKTSKVKNINPNKDGLSLEILNNLRKVKLGESININGVCSTVKKFAKNISFEYMPETLKLSNLDFLKKGDTVNTEQSICLSDRLDGHIVLGHIDTRGEIVNIAKEGNSKVFNIRMPKKKFMKFLVYKGSIAVEGISLTVAKVLKNNFLVKIIPHTLEHTNLKFKKKGNIVNLEFDILAKYANKK